MSSDPPDLGKGLFGYRKSAVNQIIADRDIMLRQAEGRVRAAEAKVAALDEQLDRLKSQLDSVIKQAEGGGPAVAAEGVSEAETAAARSQPDYEESVAAERGFPAGARYSPEDFGYESAEQLGVPAAEAEPQQRTYGWSSADETAAAAGEPPMDPQASTPPDLPAWARPETTESDQPGPAWRPGESTETAAQHGGPFEPRETQAQPEHEWMPAPLPSEPSAYHAPPPAGGETRPPERDDMTSRFLTEELAGILSAAEESASRIVERARANTQRQIMESNRLWREVQAEVAQFAPWRDQVEPVIRQVQSKVDSVRGMVEEVPERIRQALAPMADAISSIDADMAELGSALTPPLLLTPGGLEGEGQSWLPRAAQSNPGFDKLAEESPDAGEQQYEDGGDTPGPFGAEAG